MLDKNNFFTYFLGKNKERQLLIGIDVSVNKHKCKQFLGLFKDMNYSLIVYSSDKVLEEALNDFNDIIFVILINKDIKIKDIENDKRCFLFQLSNKEVFNINILKKIETIPLNINIDDFYLSKSYVKYDSLNNTLYIDVSNVSGFGLFTHLKINKNQKLFSLNGEIVTKNFLNDENFHGEWNALKDNKFLIRRNRTSYGFINHSREPNCKINTKTMEVVAIRDIQKNDEILLDYRKEPLPKEYVNGFGKNYL